MIRRGLQATPLKALAPSGRRAAMAALFMTSILMVGTIGYLLLGLSLLDAVYQTAITVTTVGFEEITPGAEASTAYRLFTLLLVLTGVAAVLFAASVFIEAIVESRVGQRREKRMQRDIDGLNGHLIVCGYGRVGRAVVARASGLSNSLVVIDESDEVAEELEFLHLVGDATHDDTLEAAGVHRASSLVAALPSDAANLFLAVSARQLNPRLRIVCRANDHESARKLRSIAVDNVVEPYEIAGSQLATAAIRPHTSAYLDQVFSVEAPNVELTEVAVHEGSDLEGCLAGVVGPDYGVVVVAVRPASTTEFINTARHAGALEGGDVIIILGDRESVEDLRHHAH